MKFLKILKSRLLITLTVILLLIVFAIGGSIVYMNSVQTTLWKNSVEQVIEVTTQGCGAFEVYIAKDIENIKKFARHLSEQDVNDPACASEINKIIEVFENDSDAQYNFVLLDSGVMYTNSGTIQLEDRDMELINALSSNQTGPRKSYLDEITGRTVAGAYARFEFKDGTKAIAQNKRTLSAVAERFTLTFFDNKGFSYITDDRGNIIMRSSHKNSNNSFANILDDIRLPENGNSKEKTDIFEKCLKENKRGAMELTINGEKNIVAFSPIRGTDSTLESEWALIVVLPNAVLMEHATSIVKSQQMLSALIAVVIAVVVMFILGEQLSYRKIKEKEQDIKYREQLFDILANNTNNVYIMLSSGDYVVEYISPNVERILGINKSEAEKDIRVMGSSYGVNLTDEHILEQIENDGQVEFDNERRHIKTGELRYFRETVYKTKSNGTGQTKRYVAVLSDRTKDKKDEEALKNALDIAKSANKAKSNFLSNMSHDIRTPMNAIIGFSTLIAKDADNPEKVREYVKKISVSGQHLLSLINDILDMSKIESGKTSLHVEEFSLAEFIEEIYSMVIPQANAKGQSFEIHSKGKLPEVVCTDKLRLNQIALNLLSNAVKYTPENGKIELIFEILTTKIANHAHLKMEVKDNGIGMSEEFVKKIFEPFTREESGAVSKIQGTGLGMAITHNIVTLMGGVISVRSKLGEGSVFTVELELPISGNDKSDDDKEFWKENSINRVLVVDDDEDICKGVQSLMDSTGVEVTYALSGKKAIELTKKALTAKKEYDVIILDWRMPEMDGMETARQIRSVIRRDVPILILTSYSYEDIKDDAAFAGIDKLMPKPFFVSNLRKAIEQIKSSRGEKKVEHKREIADSNPLKDKRILVVDDNEINLEIFVDLLETEGAKCTIAANGQEAVQKFTESAENEFELIFMDVQMPIMNGHEATRAIRASKHPQANSIPIIAMTANAFDDDVKMSQEAGMNSHLAKPIDMEKVRKVVAIYTEQ